MASRHNDFDYDLNLDNLNVEKWAYLISAFYQRCPLLVCDRLLVNEVKNKIDTYSMLIDSPQWFNDNGEFFIGLHSIEFGKLYYINSILIHYK